MSGPAGGVWDGYQDLVAGLIEKYPLKKSVLARFSLEASSLPTCEPGVRRSIRTTGRVDENLATALPRPRATAWRATEANRRRDAESRRSASRTRDSVSTTRRRDETRAKDARGHDPSGGASGPPSRRCFEGRAALPASSFSALLPASSSFAWASSFLDASAPSGTSFSSSLSSGGRPSSSSSSSRPSLASLRLFSSRSSVALARLSRALARSICLYFQVYSHC